MDFDATNLVLHIKRTVCSCIRLGCQYACDYPVVLGAGILLLFLHKTCPSLFMFLLSSSPVFLLTALLLGALLTYGEPCAPVTGEETLANQQSKTSATDCSAEEIDNVAVVSNVEKSFASQVVCTEDRAFDTIVHDANRDEEKATSVSTNTVLCEEEFSEFAKTNVIVETEEQQQQSLLLPRNVIVETEEKIKEISNVDLLEFENTNIEDYHSEVHNRYQLGEIMSSCWQPVIRQDPCSDSESDISGSSSDASMTDIIPMLDELNPPVNLGLNSSSDDEDDSDGDGDLNSNEYGADEKKNDKNDSEDNSDVDSSDSEKVSNVDSLMGRRRAKNILKFQLDRRLMDMQAADASQKMKEASRFRVQVPSISTSRPKPFDPSKDSEETIELPVVPDSAPSVLLPWRKPFNIPLDQIMDLERKLQETWTPRSSIPSTEQRKHADLYLRQSTCQQHHNDVMAESTELSTNDGCDRRSDNDSKQAGNNGELFGSLEAHIGEDMKIRSTAISDACVLEANCELEGSGQSALCPSSNGNSSEQHVVEESDSISEVNWLFKCRMEEVLVQSISESSIGQPLTVKLEDDELSGTLSADSSTLAVEASSTEGLNSRISLLSKETLKSSACDHNCDNESVQDRSNKALPIETGRSSELLLDDGHDSDSALEEPTTMMFEGKTNELLTDSCELPVLEA